MPEISVVIPSYNHAPFIERTLRSIYAQTFLPKKLIVIDDGSKDESVQIIERVLKECTFETEFIARENRGLCKTLNEGLAKAEGNYFAYIGSDDLWLPKFLEESIKLLEKRPKAVLSFGHAFVIDEDDFIYDKTNNWLEFADGNLLPQLLRGRIFSSPSVVYRRSALEKHKWNEDARLEDYEMYLKLTTEGEFAQLDQVLCAWRQHSSNTSSQYANMFPEFIEAQNRVANLLEISPRELAQIQDKLKFQSVEEFVRYGNRREAIPLMLKNLRGVKSLKQFVNLLLRVSFPQSLYQWNRERKKRNGIKKYGNVRDLFKNSLNI